MRTFLSGLFLAISALFFASMGNAATINSPVPTANYITFQGVDWAWANPCAPNQPSCGVVDMSYQSQFGWRLPTVEEISNAVEAAGGSSLWAALFGTAQKFACASAYFSSVYQHCDYGDATAGYIYNWSGGQPPNLAEETFVLRGAVGPVIPPVPVPAALPLLVTGVGALVAFSRRRKAA